MQNIVIAGHGIAGLTAGDTLRRQGFEGNLTIIGEDPHPTYSRPALSKAALNPQSDLMDTVLPEATHGATLIHGSVAGIDVAAKTVTLADGTATPYDGLVITTGTRARRFTTDPNEYTLRTLDEAAALRARLLEKPTVTIIGGGPLGMEVASGAVKLGCTVRLIQFGLPMLLQMGPVIAQVLTDVARDNGVEIIDAMVKSVNSGAADAPGFRIELDNGQTIESQVVITAIGDAPNIEWLEGSGLLQDGRLITDSRGRVADNIVAAGDVAWFDGKRSPVWTSAIEEAKIAAAGLLHGDAAPEINFQPYFWTDQFGLNVKISGPIPHEGEPIVVEGSIADRSALLHWPELGTAAAINYRMPVPRLHKLAKSALPTA